MRRDAGLHRVPGEDVARLVQRVEVVLELREDAVDDRFRRPAFGGVRGADRTRLAEQVDLVVAHAEDLPGDVLRGIAGQRGDERRDRSTAVTSRSCDSRSSSPIQTTWNGLLPSSRPPASL